MAPKATKIGEIIQNNGHYAIQGHSPFWYQSKFNDTDTTIVHRSRV